MFEGRHLFGMIRLINLKNKNCLDIFSNSLFRIPHKPFERRDLNL